MIQFKNIVPLDLKNGTAAIINLCEMYQGDANANRVGVEVYEYGAAVTPGGTCSGICRRHDGYEVPLSGTVSGNMAYVTLDANCYAVQGPITVLVKLVSGESEVTVAAAFGNVVTSGGDALIQPVEHLPDYAQLLAAIGDMNTATAAAIAAAATAAAATSYIAPTEASSTASEAHKAGEYFIKSGTLYQAISDIAEGGSIITSGAGRNCRSTTVGGELASVGAGERLIGSESMTLYCWGDSLTEGVGGYVMQPDGHNAYMAYSYPAWLGQTYNVVNLGARSENIPAIMARQGADPIALQADLAIPASKDTPVLVQQVTQIYDQTQGQGFTSKSGALVKIHKEVESPGFNPCTIAGVEGILYRELTSEPLSNDATYNYYFRRLSDGSAVTAPSGTEIQTYAMRYCRKGVAIIWMGANGGASSAADFIAKVNAMVEYGKYSTYLVIISREFNGENLEAVKTALTDGQGVCHVVSLMDELPWRGYAMAGIPYNSVDTSGWSTTDPVKKYAPLLCEYLGSQNPPPVSIWDGGSGLSVAVNASSLSGENLYGALHYSAWGYKAIAKLIQEKLGTMTLANESSEGGNSDDYGTLLYKLEAPVDLTGYNYINTKTKLFDNVDKDWTFAIKWSGTPSSPGGYPANIFCCSKDGIWKGLLYRYYAEESANILFGSGAFNVDGANNLVDNWGETNVIVITKSGDEYGVWCNSSSLAYGEKLTYALAAADAINLPLIIGARYNADGTEVQYKTAFTVEDVRVYDAALDDTAAQNLYGELSGS